MSEKVTPTPMMQQYLQIKSEYPGYLLFYRLGDFYELFYEDAIIASKILDIVLTKRAEDIPMCGVPYHAAEGYVEKIIAEGLKIAICEQLETPEEAKKRGYKAVVKRDVVKIITPGTILDANMLDGVSSNFLCAIHVEEESYVLAFADITTQDFYIKTTDLGQVNSELIKFAPKEILISDELYRNYRKNNILEEYHKLFTPLNASKFKTNYAIGKLKQFFHLEKIDVFKGFKDLHLISSGVIVDYLLVTQKANLPKLQLPRNLDEVSFMQLDLATRRSLELERSNSGSKDGSLFATINTCKTACGTRLLADIMRMPSFNIALIEKRQAVTTYFIDNLELAKEINNLLRPFPDIERLVARVVTSNCGPRDLLGVKQAMLIAIKIAQRIDFTDENQNSMLSELSKNLHISDGLLQNLMMSITEDPPYLAREGGYIKPKFSAKLDHLRSEKASFSSNLELLKEKYRKIAGVSNLKIEFNNVLGFYVEVSAANATKIKDSIFVHRQSLSNSARYITDELKDLEQKILSIDQNILNIELEIFNNICQEISSFADHFKFLAISISNIDLFSSHAIFAIENSYVKPNLDDSEDFFIEAGRHPVIEQMLRRKNIVFSSNNADVSRLSKVYLITGPNMAGKSTFLRQNALIAIMAHMGLFVPANSAKIGLIDKIFSRVGASDDLASGRSTFMVEMSETAMILNNATRKSFIILDEIGRGTSTYDGIAIAYASLEYIHHHIQAKTLFATHYHELVEMSKILPMVKSYSMKIRKNEDKIVFLHKITDEVSLESFGLYVAKIAGMPKQVLAKAKLVQEQLNKSSLGVYQPNLFEDQQNMKAIPQSLDFLEAIDIDSVTPRQALDILLELKAKIHHLS